MDVKSKKNHFRVRSMVKFLTLNFLLTGGLTASSQAMEWFAGSVLSTAASWLSGPTQRVVDAAVGYFEIEKTQENLFNEAVANSKREEAEQVVRKVFSDIKDELGNAEIKTNDQIVGVYERNMNVRRLFDAHQRWYIKYRMALLILDYTEAFRLQCDETAKKITSLIPKVNTVVGIDAKTVKLQEIHYGEFLKEIEAKRLNVGATLFQIYPYTRGGGPWDRAIKTNQVQHDRMKMWGFYKPPQVSSSLTEKTMVEILSESKREEYESLRKIRESYMATVTVLAAHGVVANLSIKESVKIINDHIQEFYKTFPCFELTNPKLGFKVFPKTRGRSNSKQNTPSASATVPQPLGESSSSVQTAPHTPQKSEPIPIPISSSNKLMNKDLLSMSPATLKNGFVEDKGLRDMLEMNDFLSQDPFDDDVTSSSTSVEKDRGKFDGDLLHFDQSFYEDDDDDMVNKGKWSDHTHSHNEEDDT